LFTLIYETTYLFIVHCIVKYIKASSKVFFFITTHYTVYKSSKMNYNSFYVIALMDKKLDIERFVLS